MARIARKLTDEGIYEVNMTPLIDVSLVLVVILMVAAPLAFQSGIALHTAANKDRHAKRPAGPGWVELTVLSDQSVRVNGAVVAPEALGQTLAPLLRESASRLVVVHCEDRVPHGAFVRVLDIAKSMGADKIAVVGR